MDFLIEMDDMRIPLFVLTYGICMYVAGISRPLYIHLQARQ